MKHIQTLKTISCRVLKIGTPLIYNRFIQSRPRPLLTFKFSWSPPPRSSLNPHCTPETHYVIRPTVTCLVPSSSPCPLYPSLLLFYQLKCPNVRRGLVYRESDILTVTRVRSRGGPGVKTKDVTNNVDECSRKTRRQRGR